MKITPILVPLYKSYHLLREFMESLNLETKTKFIVLFFKNDQETKYVRNILSDYDPGLYQVYTSIDNKFYSHAVNKLYDIYTCGDSKNIYDNTFMIFNPDCFPLEKNWLTRMKEIWNQLHKPASLGSLQYSDKDRMNVWHFGCKKKLEIDRIHELDWEHIHHYTSGSLFHQVDGNTGTGIMIDKELFAKEKFNETKFPHYSSDADWCFRVSDKGYKHYCCDVKMFHSPGNSSK